MVRRLGELLMCLASLSWCVCVASVVYWKFYELIYGLYLMACVHGLALRGLWSRMRVLTTSSDRKLRGDTHNDIFMWLHCVVICSFWVAKVWVRLSGVSTVAHDYLD